MGAFVFSDDLTPPPTPDQIPFMHEQDDRNDHHQFVSPLYLLSDPRKALFSPLPSPPHLFLPRESP